MSYTIVGVIGHIDHGKTSLVAALTGVDTDTHPEEKQRGITIDLGFAAYTDHDHRFALVDAPGHQKYIGNLLAGVSSVDVGLLVVAVDQGIQAQTLEHAAILQSLGVKRLVVAISRVDLADKTRLEELSEELQLFLEEFGYRDVPMIPISVVTGEGLEEIKTQLRQYAAEPRATDDAPFRMPIDRVFTIEGRGCVVAGTPWTGRVQLGDQLQVVRSGQHVRVRELEVHGEDVSHSESGTRTAMNLVGVSAGDLQRGDELVALDTHPPMTRFIAELTSFADAAEFRTPATVQFHTAATACEAQLRGPKIVATGDTVLVVIDCDRPIVATYGQSYLLRKPYPIGSFAGGRLLGSVHPAPRQMSRLLKLGNDLRAKNDDQRLAAWVQFYGELAIDPEWCRVQAGIPNAAIAQATQACLEREEIEQPATNLLVARWLSDRVAEAIERRLSTQAEGSEDAWLAEKAVIDGAASLASLPVISAVLQRMLEDKKLVRFRNMLALASEQTTLSKKQRAKMDQLLQAYEGTRTPPTLKEVAQQLGITPELATSLVRFASQQRILIDLGNGFVLSSDAFTQVCRDLRQLFDQHPQQSVASIRDHLAITRKHAIPILEYCDRVAITVRDGDVRRAGPELSRAIHEAELQEQAVEQH